MRSTDDCLPGDDPRLVLPKQIPRGGASEVSFMVVAGNPRVPGLREEGMSSAQPGTFTRDRFCHRDGVVRSGKYAVSI